ncbi:MAG: hypothetical protein M1813_001824 [Trichoglossum hirsutum]|nr:MAG: hypothetical protein M1813_001824 [Trichoglossum hirsutum]
MQSSVGQFCEWHAFESIRKRLLDYGYSREKALKPLEVKYITENWIVKEHFVCRSYTRHLANLGVNSTQRAESMNAVLKKTLNRQTPLLETCRRLIKEVDNFQIKLLQAETMSMTFRPRILDLNGFATILGKVTSYAIGLIAPDWAVAYGLPCRHWMLRSVLEGLPLPLSLIHPRWWLTGSPVLEGRWAIGYYDAAINPQERWIGGFRDRGQDIVIESVPNLLEQQSQLLSEQSERLMRQMVDNNEQLLAEAYALKARDREIPAKLPPPLPPNLSLQLKKKRSTRKRALTGAEASERRQKAMTRAQKRAQVAQKTHREPVTLPRRQTRAQKAAALLAEQLEVDDAELM